MTPADFGAAARLDRLPPSPWLRRVMAVLFLSWLIESYDIGLTGAVLPSLTHLYHLTTGMKSLVSISANIGIVAGIVPAGWMADRFGRKRILVWGTVGYAVLTALAGLAPGIGVFIVLRIAGGLAMGAVFPLPYVYGSELCPPSQRGRFTGIADAFLSVGYFLSPLLAVGLIPSTADATGWRIMFLLGGLPLVFAVVAWKLLPESPRWYESQGRTVEAGVVLDDIEARVSAGLDRPLSLPPPDPLRAGSAPGHEDRGEDRHEARPARPGLRAVLSPRYLRRSLMLWVTFGGTFFLFYSVQTFMPTVVHDMGFTLTSSFAFTAVIVAVSIPGKLLEAWVVERWGRRPVIVTFTVVAAGAAAAFGFVRGAVPVLILGCVISFFGIGVDPAVKVYTTESYPTEMRAVGTSATEGFGRLLSGVIGPSLVPPLLDAAGVGSVFLLVAGAALVAVVAVVVLGTETRGRTLEEISHMPLRLDQ
ncbi:MAG: MFS transporter [Actinomycetota bacterium]|nr:MFS transporter [Actinomycetota bacterium]